MAVPPSNVLPALSQNIRSHEDLPGKGLMVQVGSTTWFARSGMRAPATGQAGRTFVTAGAAATVCANTRRRSPDSLLAIAAHALLTRPGYAILSASRPRISAHHTGVIHRANDVGHYRVAGVGFGH